MTTAAGMTAAGMTAVVMTAEEEEVAAPETAEETTTGPAQAPEEKKGLRPAAVRPAAPEMTMVAVRPPAAARTRGILEIKEERPGPPMAAALPAMKARLTGAAPGAEHSAAMPVIPVGMTAVTAAASRPAPTRGPAMSATSRLV